MKKQTIDEFDLLADERNPIVLQKKKKDVMCNKCRLQERIGVENLGENALVIDRVLQEIEEEIKKNEKGRAETRRLIIAHRLLSSAKKGLFCTYCIETVSRYAFELC